MSDKRTIQQIRASFAATKVPVQTDFEALIDLAFLGPMPGNGLTQTDDGTLRINRSNKSGLELTEKGLAVLCATDSGLTIENNQLRVQGGPGIAVEEKVKLRLSPPLTEQGDKLSVRVGQGLKFEGGALTLHVDQRTVVVKSNIVHVQCDPHGGLKIDKDGQLTVDLSQLMPSG